VQDLFAASFRIGGENADAIFAAVARLVAKWAWRGDDSPPDVLADLQGEAESAGYRLRWDRLEVPEATADRLLTIELRHADDNHPTLEWRTSLDLEQEGDAVRITVAIAREATDLRLAPAYLQLRRPSLIPRLLARFPCSVGGVPLRGSPLRLAVKDVSDFVDETLRSHSRRLPVLVVAPPSAATPGAIDPKATADAVAGLAHVVVLAGHLAWKRFNEAVEREFVPPGGARLFWPGYGQGEDRQRHPMWSSRRLQSLRLPFSESVFLLLTRISVVRVPRTRLRTRLRLAVEEQRRLELASRARASADFAELLEVHQDLEDERDGLLAERGQLQRQVDDLERALRRQEANWAVVNSAIAAQDEDQSALDEPADWAEFHELIDALETDFFVVTPRAKAQCENNAYPDPGRMWRHLEKLYEAARLWHEQGATIGNRLEDWIRETVGIEVALHDQSLGTWVDFTHDDREYSREPHVKVDDFKNPGECGRIYFALDPEGCRFVVDYIGLHP
jgi:hypothetical protein